MHLSFLAEILSNRFWIKHQRCIGGKELYCCSISDQFSVNVEHFDCGRLYELSLHKISVDHHISHSIFIVSWFPSSHTQISDEASFC